MPSGPVADAFSFSLAAERSRNRAFSLGDRLLSTPNEPVGGLSGSSGSALLFLALFQATGDTKYESAMHAALKRAAQGAWDGATGLFAGISGLRAAAALATGIEPRYAALVERCDAFVESQLTWPPARPSSFLAYDVIDGWAGARLARCVLGRRAPDLLSRSLEWLISDWERWSYPHPLSAHGRSVHDLGVAHGIAGVLASIALTHDRFDAPLVRCVLETAWQLASLATEADGYPVWPPSAEDAPGNGFGSAWCYGGPGIAATLYTVGFALGDPRLAEFALDAQRRIAKRTAAEWRIGEPGLCHGVLGNALCFASVAEAADCDELRTYAEDWVIQALDALDAIDPAEILDSAEIAVALLTLAGHVPSNWMLLHALRPI